MRFFWPFNIHSGRNRWRRPDGSGPIRKRFFFFKIAIIPLRIEEIPPRKRRLQYGAVSVDSEQKKNKKQTTHRVDPAAQQVPRRRGVKLAIVFFLFFSYFSRERLGNRSIAGSVRISRADSS